jgi:hypothetical protein
LSHDVAGFVGRAAAVVAARERGTMVLLLAVRNLTHKPWRSALLFLGYGLGVSVMIVLLSIGEALITQARDERLVGGGSVTVLPEGLDVEVMKTGGLGGLFFSIPNARFVQQQLLASPRLAGQVTAVAPQIEGELLYLATPDGREAARCRPHRAPSARNCGSPAGGGRTTTATVAGWRRRRRSCATTWTTSTGRRRGSRRRRAGVSGTTSTCSRPIARAGGSSPSSSPATWAAIPRAGAGSCS